MIEQLRSDIEDLKRIRLVSPSLAYRIDKRVAELAKEFIKNESK